MTMRLQDRNDEAEALRAWHLQQVTRRADAPEERGPLWVMQQIAIGLSLGAMLGLAVTMVAALVGGLL